MKDVDDRIDAKVQEKAELFVTAAFSKLISYTRYLEFELKQARILAQAGLNEPVSDDFCLERLELSTLVSGVLDNAGIDTAGDLRSKTSQDLLKLRHFSTKSLDEVVAKASVYGIHLKRQESQNTNPT